MTKLLLSLHVIVAIVAVGPVTVAASIFPRTARDAAAAPRDPSPRAALATLHRICRVYALLALLVPALGLATAGAMGVLGDTWLTASIFLTGAAGFVLAGFVLPLQERIMRELDAPVDAVAATAGRLAMTVGLFNLLWATVTVLMIVRPGSTTGA
jgi:hypothetical protein